MITSVIPKLPFINKQATIAFYVGQLGYSLHADYGDYLIIHFPEAELHFFAFPELKPANSDFMIYLRVDEEIDLMYQLMQSKGIIIHPNGPLENKPWGQREFSIVDPNGTLLTFGQDAATVKNR